MNQQKNKTNNSFIRALLFVPIMGLILLISAFTQANHNLSNELQLLRQQSAIDTIPSKKELENEKFQFQLRNTLNEINRKSPLIILIEGKKERTVNEKYMRSIDPENIERVDVFKGEKATKKYGRRGKYGVVVIVMKKKKL